MSEVVCPFCSATLFDSELDAGECTSCMRRLPPRLGETVARGWSPMGLNEGGRGWESVRSGVGVLSVAAFLSAGALVTWVSGMLISQMNRPYYGPDGLAIFLVIGGALAALGASLLWLVGLITSLLCPQRGGLRGLVLGTACCVILGVVMLFSPFVLMAVLERVIRNFEILRILAMLMVCGGVLSIVAANLLFFVYLRGVARYFGDAALGGLLLTYGLVSGTIVMGSLASLVLFEMARMYGRDWEMLLSCGFSVEGLALMIWVGILLQKLRKVIPGVPFSRRQ
jgi:hypothetical protein